MDKVDEFLDFIITEKGLDVQSEKRDALKEYLRKTLLDRIDQAVLDNLDEDDAEELEQMATREEFNEEVADAFLRDRGVNVERVALGAMLKFRSDVLATKISPAVVAAAKKEA